MGSVTVRVLKRAYAVVFCDALATALKDNGLGGATKGEFSPHVTLTYDKVRVKPFKIAPPIHWMVRDFVLIHSVLGKTTHNHLGRWPVG